MLFNSYYGALRLSANLLSNTLLLCGFPYSNSRLWVLSGALWYKVRGLTPLLFLKVLIFDAGSKTKDVWVLHLIFLFILFLYYLYIQIDLLSLLIIGISTVKFPVSLNELYYLNGFFSDIPSYFQTRPFYSFFHKKKCQKSFRQLFTDFLATVHLQG